MGSNHESRRSTISIEISFIWTWQLSQSWKIGTVRMAMWKTGVRD